MRFRTYPAVGFAILCLLSAYVGLAPTSYNPALPSYGQSDKVLHFITFFLLTLCFYWILETNRRKNLQLTLLVCPGVLGVGSEIVQGLLPNGRAFDLLDIFANVVGSGAALAICVWYHKRMLERKRHGRTFGPLAEGEEEDFDVELGEGIGSQENGVIPEATLEAEVDNWDENAEDWDEDEANEDDAKPSDDEVGKKRND
ncbi:hypothetical protein BT63DRAFT_441744 [Microthyrium microscopicum]|uniref:VanZ-like domain-containing protein n=1 Tax=Microthyrium microscopicum TaxID=703497 RepID=A0A6A6U5T9_9PEZI|nr:hypothetical protein BT63DRAFT_441744 [Microthyrium microscopicum]